MDWEKAANHLYYVIAEYTSIGFSGFFALRAYLLPLKERYDNGERSQELYDEIMACE